MEERGLVDIEARNANGEELGRISDVVTDESSGEVTYVLVERAEESLEVPISQLVLEPGSDFATVMAGAAEDEPRDHAGGDVEPEVYAPAESGMDDQRHAGQLVTEPTDPSETSPREDLDWESGEADGWQDEDSTPADSGYPRTDAYIDPETGEATEGYPEAEDAPSLEEAVAVILEDTGLQAVSISDGIVELAGSVAREEELDRIAASIMALEEVFEVDSGAVDTG